MISVAYLRGSKEEAVLATVKAVGIIGLFLVAPNAVQYLAKKKKRNIDPSGRYYLEKVTNRLIDQGMLCLDKNGQVSITEKGDHKLDYYEAQELPRPKRWDGKYRVIVFDINEKRKKDRDNIRRQLTSWGFSKLQNSVWVYPFDCEEIVSLLKERFLLKKDILYMLVDVIENDRWLREVYNLPFE